MNTTPAEKLLNSAKKKVAQAEVSFSEGEEQTVSFESGKLKTIETDFSSSVGLRLIKDGRIGVAATNELEELEGLVAKALAVAEFGPQARFTFPGPSEFFEPKVLDPRVVGVRPQNLVEKGREIIKRIERYDPKILVDLDFESGVGRSILLNSTGLRVEKEAASCGFEVLGKIIREGDFLKIFEGNSSRLEDLNVDFYVDRLIGKFGKARKIVRIKPGRYPVLFTPRSFGDILSYIILALNGKTVVKKSSRLRDKLGEKAFDERLTVVDDGSLDWKMDSAKCDSEGVPIRPLTLIKEGVVKNFFFDLQTAGQMKTKSTGHGGRGKADALASPASHNILISGGRGTYKSVLKHIKEGILAEELLGMGQENPYNGDFSANLWLGYKIENGEIVGRVKDTMIAGNAFELLKNGIGEISRETEWVGNTFKSPSIVLEGVRVASKR